MFGNNLSGHTTEVFLGNFSICMAFGPGLYKSRRYLGYENEGWKALHRRKRNTDGPLYDPQLTSISLQPFVKSKQTFTSDIDALISKCASSSFPLHNFSVAKNS